MESYNLISNRSATSRPIVSRPRILLYGDPTQGHTTHLAPALLHCMEKLPVHVLDLPTLYANSARTPEESCSQVTFFQNFYATVTQTGLVPQRYYSRLLNCLSCLMETKRISSLVGIQRSEKSHTQYNIHTSHRPVVAGVIWYYESYIPHDALRPWPTHVSLTTSYIRQLSSYAASWGK